MSSDDEWQDVRGPHGYGETNEAGKELLSFLSINKTTVCNTWFQKRPIHKATWQHPGTKQWHCFDFVMMHQAQRRKCLDVSVMRGAEANSDHQMLRMKLNISSIKSYKKINHPKELKPGSTNHVSKLKGPESNEKGELTAKGWYIDMVSQCLEQLWSKEDTIEKKWEAVKSALCESAEWTLGVEKKRSPDWLRESETELSPLFENRNKLYKKWLCTGRESDKRSSRRRARRPGKGLDKPRTTGFSRKHW